MNKITGLRQGSQCRCSPDLSETERSHAGAASRSLERGEAEKGFPGHLAWVSELQLCPKMVLVVLLLSR